MTEGLFYNAINIITGSDYRKLEKEKERFGNWKNAWQRNGDGSDPEKKFVQLSKLGVRLIMKDDHEYPPLLREIPHPPFGIYVLGNLPQEYTLTLAIVGTRKATTEGKMLARNFSSSLASAGLKIVSGLALGIDAEAHEGCLSSGGQTVAVLGNGLDYFYPRTNERLAKKILDNGGAIVSEYPLGAKTLPYRFLERNRIVSGLSRGILVIEAPEKSGALATARFALEQNRDIFVLPGSISHPNFKGSNQLIRAGAELVVRPEEILETFGVENRLLEGHAENAKTPEERAVIQAMEKISTPASVDKIVELTHLEISSVNRALTFLAIKNLINESEGGYTIKK